MATREQQSHWLPALVIGFLLVASADARIIYVDHSAGGSNSGASWADALTDLTQALWKAHPNDEIRVAQGTYRPALPTGDRGESFDLGRASGATIRGGYAGLSGPDPDAHDPERYVTILSGDLRGDDEPGFQHDGENCYHVLTGAGTDPTTVLEGFIITGGHANGQGPDEPCGAGLYNEGGSLTIRDCHFLGNIGQDNGGAVFNKAGALKLIRCRFSGNRATNGGALHSMDSGTDGRPVLLACRFSDNWADNRGGGLYHSNSHVELIGCAFYANWAGDGGGVYNDRSDPNLINCLFSANRAEQGGGVYNDLSRPNLVNCTFSRNAADDFGGGLYNFDASPTLTNCILWANSATGRTDEAAQIYTNGGVPEVRHCCIQGWTDQWVGPGNIDRDPRFADDDGPDDKLGTEDDDLSLRRKSPCIDAGDSNALPSVTFDSYGKPQAAQQISYDYEGNLRVSQDVVDIGAFEFYADPEPGDVIFVNATAPSTSPRDGSSWETAYVSLQKALQVAKDYSDYSEPPRQIWVAKGTYTPSAAGTRENATFSLVSNVAVYGGFAGSEAALEERDPERYVTILSGDLQHNDVNVADPCDLLSEPTRSDNCCNVVTGSETDANAVLDGFTIAGGMANGALSDASGGGIYIRSGSLTLRGCTFRANAATAGGGAIYCRSRAPKILECTIRDNSAGKGAGIYCENSSPTIQDNTIVGNYAVGDGAGIACADQSAPVVEHNTIHGNWTLVQMNGGGSGGGIACLENSGPQILRNTILRNSSFDGGGIYCIGAYPTILNNMIIANTAADDGGGICAIDDSQPVIRNNTIVRNRSNPQGGGIYCDSSQAAITNCILWENGDDFHNWSPENDCNATYSCIQDGDPGVGNISIYPHFVDPEHDDYHLKSYSPCIDAGEGKEAAIELRLSGEVDLDGNARVKNLLVDMGAYETDFWKRMQDTDNDGLPDDWEYEHLGGLQFDANDDPDGDTYRNRFEYEKGVSPGVAQRSVVYVSAHGGDAQADGSPEHPFASIQQGINVVGEEGEVRVTEGTFHERLVIDGKIVYIRGGYTLDFAPGGDYTVLSADRRGRGVLYVNVPAGLLTGLRITNGWEKDGAGMYLHHSSPEIRHNIIEDNNAVEDGGGVSFYCRSQPLFEDNIVRDNSADDNAGGFYCRGSAPTIRRCEITGNRAGDGGGAMRVRGEGEPNITDCNIIGNSAGDEGGAIVCREQRGEECAASLRLTRCAIRDNRAEGENGRGGLVLRPGTHTTIADSSLCGNTPPGLWADGSTIRVEGIVETFDSNWVITDVNIVRNLSGAGAAELRTGPGTELIVDNCGLQCDLTGPATIKVDWESQFRIEGRARVNLATDPETKGTIECEGLLFVRDNARITGARIRVTRASFEGDVNISNSVITAEAGVPYGQFFVADTVQIADSNIYADGDRYMDLDPSVFAGLIEKNRIFVEITEGVGHTCGGLFELRGLDLYGNPSDPPDQFLYPCQVPDFSTVTWTIEELKLAPGAKLNLTNRFDFQTPYTEGGENEVLYVRHLVLGPNSVLNTAFNRVYYETKDVNDSAVIESVPLLGFSLNNIAFDSENEFLARVRHNNTTDPDKPRHHVQWVADAEPDPKGMMQMCNLPDTDPNSPTFGQVMEAWAKGLFAKSNEPWIQIRFEYLFCDPAGQGELVIYLSDCPELLSHDDPTRSLHYLEVAHLPHPPGGRPGSAQSGEWGIFEQVVPVGMLNFVRGTRIELELLGPAGTCVLINNWDPGIRCISAVCGDVAGGDDSLVTPLDFLAVLSECGRRIYAGASEESDLGCLDGFFCADGYVTVDDALAVDWTTTERKSLCWEKMLVDDSLPAESDDLSAAAGPGPRRAGLKRAGIVAAGATQNSAAAPVMAGQFLVAAKRYESSEHDFLSDRLYGLDDRGNLVGAPFRLAQDRCNGRLVRDPAGNLYQLNLELGLVRVADNAIVVAPGRFPLAPEPRYEESALVYVGLQEQDYGLWSRPMLDAAFDAEGYLYIVPVVVPDVSKPYVAAARFRLSGSSQSPDCSIDKVFDDRPPDKDNMARSQLREVEVDRDGNVYVLNRHYLVRSDTLWVYDRDGKWQVRLDLQKCGISAPVGLCVSACDRRLYLASAENLPDANSVKVHVLSTATWSLDPLPTIEIHGMGHVTDITEDPATGTLCVVGFEMSAEAIPTDSEFQAGGILRRPPFYEPRLAFIPFGTEGPVEATWPAQASAGNDMRLPLSVICTEGTIQAPGETP